MRTFVAALACSLALGFLSTIPAAAQTPDGQTPAEESVCDPLAADGVTKGLYGLCVGFCEARKILPTKVRLLQEEELALLEAGAPSGRILDNYNRKKQEDDPPMPCIVPDEPCPCWTDAELQSIDGFLPSGGAVPLQCGETRDSETGALTFSRTREGVQFSGDEQVVLAWDEPEGDDRKLRRHPFTE